MEMRRYPIELAPTPIPIACISGTPPWCPSYTHSLIMEMNMNQPILPSPAADFRNDPCTRDSKMANPGVPIPSHHSRQHTSSLPCVIDVPPSTRAASSLFIDSCTDLHPRSHFPQRRTSVGELQRRAHARSTASSSSCPKQLDRPTRQTTCPCAGAAPVRYGHRAVVAFPLAVGECVVGVSGAAVTVGARVRVCRDV